MAELELRGVAKAYGSRQAVAPLDLVVADGELLTVLGPSGSGKTTLLRLVCGLEAPDAGTILIGGRDVTSDDPGARNVGMVFQGHALFPHLDVRRNIAYGMQARRVPAREIGPRVEEVAERLGLGELLDRRPGRLSGGERQRVALARALVRTPDLLLLDEPLSSLDAPLRAELRREIARLQGELRLTMVYVTHDQSEALALGDRVAVMRTGAIDQVGTPEEVYSRPRTLEVARFVGLAQINVLEAESFPALAAGRQGALLAVRPEDVGVAGSRLNVPGAVSLPGRVELIEPAGDHALLTLALDGGGRLTARIEPELRPEAGHRTEALVDPARVHRFDAASGERLG